MTFTADPTTARGKVRLLIADTDTTTIANQVYTDAEIDAFLALESNEIYGAASAAALGIASSAARSAIAWRALGESVDLKEVPRHFREIAATYRDRAVKMTPAEEIDSLDYRISQWGADASEYVGDEV